MNSSPDGNKAFPYDPIWTNNLMLDEFGVGIGLYFRSLKAAIYLLVIVAGINVLSAVKNAEYNPTLSAVHAVNSSASVINPILFYGSVLGAKRESEKCCCYKSCHCLIVISLYRFICIASRPGELAVLFRFCRIYTSRWFL